MSSSSSSSARSLHHDHSVLTAVPLINCLLIAVANELVIGPPPPPPLATSLHNRLAAVSLLFGVFFLLPFRDHRTNQAAVAIGGSDAMAMVSLTAATFFLNCVVFLAGGGNPCFVCNPAQRDYLELLVRKLIHSAHSSVIERT